MTDIKLSYYQDLVTKSRQWRKYSNKDDLHEAVLGLCGEAGEVSELFKKLLRDNKFCSSELKSELGDVLYYVVCIANCYGMDLNEILHSNVDKLEKRGYLK